MYTRLTVTLFLAACAAPQHDTNARSVQEDATVSGPVLREEFVAELLSISQSYEEWSRLGDVPNWAPELCTAPPATSPLVSQSRDEDTHGRKLYFLYARDVAAYRAANDRDQPTGQAFVKQSFESVPLPVPEDANQDEFNSEFGKLYWDGLAIERDGKRWKLGTPRELFVMFKLDPATPETDEGWVYGTVTREGEVTSAGQVSSCMDCHLEAGRDRMFGASTVDILATDTIDAYELLQAEEQ